MLLVPTGAAVAGAVLPYTGIADLMGFTPLPTTFFLLLFAMVIAYLVLVEAAKTRFYRTARPGRSTPRPTPAQRRERRLRRRAAVYIRHVAPRRRSAAG